jgi:ABC-type multidrug transport system fused ATPase/permease subunit
MVASLVQTLVRSVALIASVHCLYYSLNDTISLPVNATDGEKNDAFSAAAGWAAGFGICLTLAELIPNMQAMLLDSSAMDMAVRLATNVMRAFYNLSREAYATATPAAPVHHFGFSFEHIAPANNSALIGKVIGCAFEMIALIIASGIDLPWVAGIVLAGLIPFIIQTIVMANRYVSPAHSHYVSVLDSSYYGVFAQAQKYNPVQYYGRKQTEVNNTTTMVKKLAGAVKSTNRAVHLSSIAASLVYALPWVGALIYITYASIFELEDKLKAVIPMLLVGYIRNSALMFNASFTQFLKNVKPYQHVLAFNEAGREKPDDGFADLVLDDGNATIHFDRVRFSYATGFTLDDVSLTLEQGTASVLIGASGCGKSTVLSLLLALNRPSGGVITIGGHNLAEYNSDSVRRLIGFVPQQIEIVDGDIMDNIRYGLPDVAGKGGKVVTDGDVRQAAIDAGLAEFVAEGELAQSTGVAGKTLSGGQIQRIAIARAFLRQVAIYVFDEPTSALDPATRDFVLQTIQALVDAGKTVVIVTHDLAAVQAKVKVSQPIDVGRFASMAKPSRVLELQSGDAPPRTNVSYTGS